jgi:large subunit ribosomal protein L25
MEKFSLNASTREILGSKVKHLRNEGKLPAVLYGHETKNLNLSVDLIEFEKTFKQTGTSTIVDLKIDESNPVKILVHEPQRHPVTDQILHVDFYKVNMKEEIRTEIPLEFIGIAPAVANLEGNLITNKDAVEVECLPDKLVQHIEVDISSLKTFENIIKVSDLIVPEGIKVLNDSEETIAQVTPPRSEEELAEMEEGTAADEEKAAIENIEAQAEAEKAEEEGESTEEQAKKE